MEDSKYKYWKVVPDKKQKESILIALGGDDYSNEEIEKTEKELQNCLANYKKLKDERDGKKGKNGRSRSQIENDIICCETTIKELKSKINKWSEIQNAIDNNADKKIKVERIKDAYSRKEAIRITIMEKNSENGIIVISVVKIKEDIYKLEEYGLLLTPPFFDELAKIIKNRLATIQPIEQDFIENDVPSRVVNDFCIMCYAQIYNEKGTRKDNSELEKEGVYIVDGNDFVKADTFKKWYNDSKFRGYSITSIKEALSIHGIVKCNTGRNDYTSSKNGKGILFYSAELKNFEE